MGRATQGGMLGLPGSITFQGINTAWPELHRSWEEPRRASRSRTEGPHGARLGLWALPERGGAVGSTRLTADIDLS